MTAHVRKFIGIFVILGFMIAYGWAAIAVGERLPQTFWMQVIYYPVAGMAWALPLKPLFGWMNRGR
jgi:hypothetical protein